MNINDIETKVDSPEKLAAVANLPTNQVLFAPEFNAVVYEVKKSKIIQYSKLLIFKTNGNIQEKLEPGDLVIGFVQGTFLNAGEYLTGNPLILTSYVGFD